MYEKGRFKTYLPKIEHKVLLSVKTAGGKFSIDNCLPEKPLEMRPENQHPFYKSANDDYSEFITSDERDAFKLCVISGFEYKPDNNSLSLRPGQKGQIATPSPAQCRVVPVVDDEDPSSITHPVRWKLEMKADRSLDYLIAGLQKTRPRRACEVKCF